MPKVSVLMSVYNRAAYVGQAIESVIQQTFTDWELIVVNDGSTDGSVNAIGPYLSHLVYLEQPNKGLSAGLNRAFRHSSGDYILFLASDDLLLPDALERLSTFLDDNPQIGVVHSDGYVCTETGEIFGKFSDYKYVPLGETFLEQLVVTSFVNIGDSALTRRTWLGRVDGPFDEEMWGFEDWDLCIRLVAAGCLFDYIDDPTFKYRVHAGQKSSSKSTISERRLESLIRNRLKVINASYFSLLSVEVRKFILYILLVQLLQGKSRQQEEILRSAAFASMPKLVQADLLYYVGVSNILDSRQVVLGRERLWRAVKLNSQSPKIHLALALSSAGRLTLAMFLKPWRAIHQLLHPNRSELPVGQRIQPQARSGTSHSH